VKNVARPEGNITGFARSFSSLGQKWLQLLKEAAPSLKWVAFLEAHPPCALRWRTGIRVASKRHFDKLK